ncbi:MAG: hypothetical protein LBC18_00765 [Opitutaceae bacterium]|jgi:hypothetical protein|nr:hypothetical protein [Opitutaceae bacterium]
MLTRIFSGRMSMNPCDFSPFVFPAPPEAFLFPGGPSDLSRFSSVPELPENTGGASLLHYAKQPLVLASSREGLDRLLSAIPGTEPAPFTLPQLPSPADARPARARKLMPGTRPPAPPYPPAAPPLPAASAGPPPHRGRLAPAARRRP